MSACEDCHALQHEHDADIRRLLAVGPTDEMLALCRGYLSITSSPGELLALYAAHPVTFAGRVAATLALLDLDDALAVERLVHFLLMGSVENRGGE